MTNLNLTQLDFNNTGLYSAHPVYLSHCLSQSLQRLNLATLDCVYLITPYENLRPLAPSNEAYYDQLAQIF